jgi:hypothetical protein
MIFANAEVLLTSSSSDHSRELTFAAIAEGHPKATRAYAWSSPIEGSDKRRFFAVLQMGAIKSPANTIRAAIAAEHRGRENELEIRFERFHRARIQRFRFRAGRARSVCHLPRQYGQHSDNDLVGSFNG